MFPTICSKVKSETAALGYGLLWLLGVPIPVLAVIYLLKGCN